MRKDVVKLYEGMKCSINVNINGLKLTLKYPLKTIIESSIRTATNVKIIYNMCNFLTFTPNIFESVVKAQDVLNGMVNILPEPSSEKIKCMKAGLLIDGVYFEAEEVIRL